MRPSKKQKNEEEFEVDENFMEGFHQKYLNKSPNLILKEKLTDLCILLQETSRRSLHWPTIKIATCVQDGNNYVLQSHIQGLHLFKDSFQLPLDLINFLYANNMILAGGSVVDLLIGKEKSNDFDLFCIGERPKIKSEDYYETRFSYSTFSYPKIQIIKRIYDSPEQVIGGFDLDCSRFYMNSHLEIFCTMGGFISLEYRINPINFSGFSASFGRRINKYQKKGFKPHFVNSIHCSKYLRPFRVSNKHFERKFAHDYDLKLSSLKSDEYNDDQSKLLRLNFTCLMKQEFDGFCILKGRKFEKKEFLEYAKTIRFQESYKYHHFPKFGYSTSPYDFSSLLEMMEYNQESGFPEEEEKQKYLYNIRIGLIHKYYNEYLSIIDKFVISNPGTQATSSFHPIELKTQNEHRLLKQNFLGTYYISHDSSVNCPDIITFLIFSKMKKLPKPISHMIASYICFYKLNDLWLSTNERFRKEELGDLDEIQKYSRRRKQRRRRFIK